MDFVGITIPLLPEDGAMRTSKLGPINQFGSFSCPLRKVALGKLYGRISIDSVEARYGSVLRPSGRRGQYGSSA